MENAGLITFADGFLIAKPGEESTGFRHDAANTIAHELSHVRNYDILSTSIAATLAETALRPSSACRNVSAA